MYSFHKIKAAATTLIVGLLLASAFTATAQAGNGGRKGLTAQQWKAVRARAQATDRFYGMILVASGLAVTVRRRGGDKPSVSRST